ncbi:selenoprotein W family protein [Sclerotinia borealis F-4128]|uniref:Selenoprotein W family protein n=1 Tax=Sclerotinia borealis (strain F-4128) TaxID=1432307 RepID=W9CDY2_SCLBF|nr:selenoprotein W family protein [Sclerotinia borealis F-4128]
MFYVLHDTFYFLYFSPKEEHFAQELLSTFGTDIGEVALQPSTGGTFIVDLFTDANASFDGKGSGEKGVKVLKHTLWNRKSEGGFPETKELKKRVRNIIDPSRDLGHVDGKKSTSATTIPSTSNPTTTNPPPITNAISALQPQLQPQPNSAERKITPMDIVTSTSTSNTPNIPSTSQSQSQSQSQPAISNVNEEKGEGKEKVQLNERGKIVITGGEGEGGFGVCRPGDEECGGF